jgi:hypothetical protein
VADRGTAALADPGGGARVPLPRRKPPSRDLCRSWSCVKAQGAGCEVEGTVHRYRESERIPRVAAELAERLRGHDMHEAPASLGASLQGSPPPAAAGPRQSCAIVATLERIVGRIPRSASFLSISRAATAATALRPQYKQLVAHERRVDVRGT